MALNAKRILKRQSALNVDPVLSARKLVEFTTDHLDENLPPWARRSDSVVRRHLGGYWKTFVLDVHSLIRMYIAQVVLVLASFLIPAMFTLIMPIVTVSLVLVPLGLALHVIVLYSVGKLAAAHVADERRSRSLDILRTTPRTLTRILASKGAAAVWRYTEDMVLPLSIAMLCSLPALVIQYDTLLGVNSGIGMRFAIIAALGTSVLRLVLETIMIAGVGLFMGANTLSRTTASVSTLLIGIGYFASINLMRLLPFGIGWNVFIEIIAPLVFPPIITAICLYFAVWTLKRD